MHGVLSTGRAEIMYLSTNCELLLKDIDLPVVYIAIAIKYYDIVILSSRMVLIVWDFVC